MQNSAQMYFNLPLSLLDAEKCLLAALGDPQLMDQVSQPAKDPSALTWSLTNTKHTYN